jgi:hypothetical protein
MVTAQQQIEKKLKYYEGQLNSYIDNWIKENTRVSRDLVIKTKEKIRTYKECLTIISEN